MLVPNTPDDPAYHGVPPARELNDPGKATSTQLDLLETAASVPWPADYSSYNFTQSDPVEQSANIERPTVVSLDENHNAEQSQVPPVQYISYAQQARTMFPGLLPVTLPTTMTASQPLTMTSPTPSFSVPQPIAVGRPLPAAPPVLGLGQGMLAPPPLGFQTVPGVVPMVLPAATTLASLTPQQISITNTPTSTLVPGGIVPGGLVSNNLAPNAVTSTPSTTLDTSSPAKAAGTGDCHWVNITNYLNLPQSEAAKQLNIPTSSLSKRWKESARNRKWPYRAVCKLDKEIMTLMHNIPPGSTLPADMEEKLSKLLRERQEMLKPVIIRL